MSFRYSSRVTCVPIIEVRHACLFALFLAIAYAELGLVKPRHRDKITESRQRKGLRVIIRRPARFRVPRRNYREIIVTKCSIFWDAKLSLAVYYFRITMLSNVTYPFQDIFFQVFDEEKIHFLSIIKVN